VTTSIVWDSGFDPYNPSDSMGLHAPVLYAYGGSTDYANWDAIGAYQETSVPTVLASNDSAGHTGMWDDPSPPAQPPGPYQNEPLAIAPQWLDFTLYGGAAGRAYFLGSPCGLCQRPGWSVQAKNWDAYKASPPPAPPPGAGPQPVPPPVARRRARRPLACRGGRAIGHAARARVTVLDARLTAVLICVSGMRARAALVTLRRGRRLVARRRTSLQARGTRVLLEPRRGRFAGGRYLVAVTAGRAVVRGSLRITARGAA
jgi:hypothetical protein